MTDTERERITAICKVAGVTEIDDLSDGFHTFRQLYYQRMMLFATIVRQNKDKAWKSLRHEDGELCFGGGWFIVGIDTPEGSYTYHYEDNYYSLFDCEELERGKHWDGHTEKDVTRLLSLSKAQLFSEGTTKDAISRQAAIDAVEKNACNTQRIMDAVNNLPPAQPEPTYEQVEEYCKKRCLHVVTADFFESTKPQRLGHWIKRTDPFDGEQYECSECGVLWEFNDGTPEDNEAYFCPKCGAKMKGVRQK